DAGFRNVRLQSADQANRILRSVHSRKSCWKKRANMSTDEPGALALATLRGRITRIIPEQIRACIEELSDEQLWWRPNEQTNSVGNLVLHLSGSMRHYLSPGVGGIAY